MEFKLENVTIGADPELFLRREDGTFTSAYGVLPGTKDTPFPLQLGAVQVDGTAAEFNITPARTKEEFLEHIESVTSEMARLLPREFTLTAQPTVLYKPAYFQTLPDESKMLGCDPDFSAWDDGDIIESHGDPKYPMRTGGGHIHIGWGEGLDVTDEAHIIDCIKLTKQLDSVLYPQSCLFDTDVQRRTMYGQPGSFRPKPYGVEYRVLSNAWVADPDLAGWVFDSAKEAVQLLMVEENEIYEDVDVMDMIGNAEYMQRDALLAYHDAMLDYELPSLPDKYLSLKE